MNYVKVLSICLAFCLFASSNLFAVDFDKDIRPIFKEHCYKCHGSEKRNGGLALHRKSIALGIMDSGEKAIHPGHPEKSHLVELISKSDPKLRMPRKGPALSKAQIDLIKQWIAEGAIWPDDPDEVKHWAYIPPKKVGLPNITKSTWPSNGIDHFTFAKMEEKGLEPNPLSKPAQLIRRLSLDLTGLPPSIKDVDAFVKNPSSEAYEKFVEKFLASKSFGEKWARAWLDLARYADSDGYQRDGFRDMWLFRDYVIESMNKDLPFDQFTIEQLAGDLLPNPTKKQFIATAFHRNPILNLEAGTDAEEDRVKQVVDRVNTTGTVWLGTSLVCAQCHNHKYDPISITEYYQLYAYFNNSSIEGQRKTKGGATMIYVGNDKKFFKDHTHEYQYKQMKKNHESITVKYIKVLKDECSPNKKDDKKVSQDKKSLMNAIKNKDKVNYNAVNRLVNKLFKKNQGIMNQHKAFNDSHNEYKNLGPMNCRIMDDAKPRKTMILKRGNFLTPGKEVKMGAPAVLHSIEDKLPKNRLGLAKWLVSKDNPLVARVTVNRWWYELFGHGIVASLDDFGKQGELPTHPELLDWLAIEFMDQGWSMKQIIKTMVMSSTYKQSTIVTQNKLNIDLNNKYYSRGNNHRYSAEIIRDNALAISGLLSTKMGGPPVMPIQPNHIWRVAGQVDNTYRTSKGEDAHRRAIYTIWRRSAHYPSLRNFDAPNRGACTVKRSISNTPLQALTLLNDEAYVEMAKTFALNILNYDNQLDASQKAKVAFRKTLSREPSNEELKVLTDVYQQELSIIKKTKDKAKQLKDRFILPKNTKLDEWAAWYSVASILLNCHETITRN